MTRTSRRRRGSARQHSTRVERAPGTPETPVFWLSAALLTLAFIFGGQSRDSPLSTMIIELLGVTLMTAMAWSGTLNRFRRTHKIETILLGAMLLVPVLQLIPLPPAVWIALPGRGEIVETLQVAGIKPGWAPISLDPESTFRCLLWLAAPAALFLAVTDMEAGSRFRLAGALLALCIGSLILGGLQITDQNGGLFASPAGGHTDVPIGFFANRNHQGIAMVAALPFAAAFAAIWRSIFPQRANAANIIFGAIVALLLVGSLVSRSRASLILAGPALIAGIVILGWTSGAQRMRRTTALAIGAGTVGLLFVAQFAINIVFDRFETLAEGDARLHIWSATLRAGAAVAPVGTGLGTFVPIYRSWEPLELMGPNFVNQAHNEYLELWLETGWLGPVVLCAFLLWFGKATLNTWRAPATPLNTLARAGGAAALILMIHSVADYPLRTLALACVFAFATACLAAGGRYLSGTRV